MRIFRWFFRDRHPGVGTCARCAAPLAVCGSCTGDHAARACADCLRGLVCPSHRAFRV